jgi:hypothetical protein
MGIYKMATFIETIAGQKRGDIHFVMMKEKKNAQREKDKTYLAATQAVTGFEFIKDTMDNWESKIKRVRCLASLDSNISH